MKKLTILFLWVSVWTLPHASVLERIHSITHNIGKQTPIDIALYAKNSSYKCSLSIRNIVNPYGRHIVQNKIQPIILEKGRYFRSNAYNLLKGAYEFEYMWSKNNMIIDSSVKTIHIFAYHDIRNKIHKKVNLTFLKRIPKVCK